MSSTKFTERIDVRKGLSAAAGVLAAPVALAAALEAFDATSGFSARVGIETSGSLFHFLAEREATVLQFGWPVWLGLTALVFLWASGAFGALALAMGRKPMATNSSPFAGFDTIDRMRLALAVERVDSALFLRVPRRRRKEIRQELEANLAESAAAQGVGPALAELGSIRKLTRSYLDATRKPFDVGTGLTAMLGVAYVLAVLAFVMSFAFIQGWELAGRDVEGAYSFGFFAVKVMLPLGFGVGFDMAVVLPILIVSFLLGTQAWRLRRGTSDPVG